MIEQTMNAYCILYTEYGNVKPSFADSTNVAILSLMNTVSNTSDGSSNSICAQIYPFHLATA